MTGEDSMKDVGVARFSILEPLAPACKPGGEWVLIFGLGHHRLLAWWLAACMVQGHEFEEPYVPN